MFKRLSLFLFSLFFIVFLVACGGEEEETTDTSEEVTEETTEEDEGEAGGGGEVRVALNAQPPTIDPMFSTAVSTIDVSRPIYESLLTIDSSFQPQPMLAESVETDDNQTFVFEIREGIKFHNGDEMTADDVVASMERWMTLSSAAME